VKWLSTVFIVFCLLSSRGFALNATGTLVFCSGVAAGMFAHELSHAAVGIATGGSVANISLVNAGISYPDGLSQDQLNAEFK
jgi:hypothetical protein